MVKKLVNKVKDILERIECTVNHHYIPENQVFMANGAYFQGGYCGSCNQLVQGRFLGNHWDRDAEWRRPGWKHVSIYSH